MKILTIASSEVALEGTDGTIETKVASMIYGRLVMSHPDIRDAIVCDMFKKKFIYEEIGIVKYRDIPIGDFSFGEGCSEVHLGGDSETIDLIVPLQPNQYPVAHIRPFVSMIPDVKDFQTEITADLILTDGDLDNVTVSRRAISYSERMTSPPKLGIVSTREISRLEITSVSTTIGKIISIMT